MNSDTFPPYEPLSCVFLLQPNNQTPKPKHTYIPPNPPITSPPHLLSINQQNVLRQLPSTSLDLERDQVPSSDDLPPYTTSPTSTEIPLSELNHDHPSLLAHARTHHLTAADIHFLAARPEYRTPAPTPTPEQQRAKRKAEGIVALFLLLCVFSALGGVIFIAVRGVMTGKW
ncbi:hypothetical protein GLAREA_00309 [Glarea lozoyensis ATCC 20868]|uniref:Uncharacterized protein n=1 Tax=Glarea lozoyensis (strain ATCC 20868 / MF5171) TaxID=1116229 RepID=S3CW36_GLAL2|nr:uncharacterized protein GLAREA_00309 [Glarea lozoyensis ATCC 20868]EPE29149.1 hypothetical protein GLAREA_00309 [Glarea lozoyensis ATCC 20868]